MCYLVAKRISQWGSIAVKVQNRKDLTPFSYNLYKKLDDDVLLVVLSNPSAYKEYAPYTFVKDYQEVEKTALSLNKS